jgi:hypothetical protein
MEDLWRRLDAEGERQKSSWYTIPRISQELERLTEDQREEAEAVVVHQGTFALYREASFGQIRFGALSTRR